MCGEGCVVEVSKRSVEVQELWEGTEPPLGDPEQYLPLMKQFLDSTAAEQLSEVIPQGYLFGIRRWLMFWLRTDN